MCRLHILVSGYAYLLILIIRNLLAPTSGSNSLPPEHDYTLFFEPIGIVKHGAHLRPFFMQFIKWASKHFDIVMWSWKMPLWTWATRRIIGSLSFRQTLLLSLHHRESSNRLRKNPYIQKIWADWADRFKKRFCLTSMRWSSLPLLTTVLCAGGRARRRTKDWFFLNFF